MNLLFVVYVLLCIIVIAGTFYFNNKQDHKLAAYVMPLLFLAIAVFFGMRWFTTSGEIAISTNLSPVWPPPNSINVCPDFLSLRDEASGSTTNYYCVDTLGVSTTASGLQQWSTSASDSAKFPLGSVTGKVSNWLTPEKLCENCRKMGLTWEGVCIPGSPMVQLAPNSKIPPPV